MGDSEFSSPSSGPFKKMLMIYLGILGLCVLVAAIAGLYMRSQKTDSKDEPILVRNQSFDSSYFSVPEKPDKKVVLEEVEPETQPQEATDNIVYVEKPVYVDRPIYIPEKDIVIDLEEPVKRLNPTDELRKKLLAQRHGRSSVAAVNQVGAKLVEVELDKNRNPNWDKFGIESEIASYPVNMERVITNDMYIQATLIDAVLSEFPDRVTAVISNNIYGAHGKKVLIPAGSKAVGSHGTIEAVGNTRVPVTWEFINRPDGVRIKLNEPISSSDGIGRAGLPGQVDRRYDEKYTAALLISSVSVLTNLVAANNVAEGTQINNLTNSLDDISKQIITENADIKPILMAEQGQTILLKPTTDIWFQEPCGKEIKTVRLDEIDEIKRSLDCEKTVHPG